MSLAGFKPFIVIFILVKLCSTEQNLKHKARINYKLKDEHVSEEINSRSFANCLINCSLQHGCITVSFKSPTEMCLLSSYDTIDDSAGNHGIPATLIFADGWTTMSRMRYPVFHAVGTYERYSMTFQQAKQQCIDYGTSIATPSELIQARDMGYTKCVCGWLSNGRNGLVVQSYRPSCGYSDTIKYCDISRANVFCKLV